jgi:hypothetical protein
MVGGAVACSHSTSELHVTLLRQAARHDIDLCHSPRLAVYLVVALTVKQL